MLQIHGRLNFNMSAAQMKIAKRVKHAQKILDTIVIGDMAQFTPWKSGNLERSAHNNKIGSGIIGNETPYARYQYYGDGFNFTKDRNPKATSRWFEVAKSTYKDIWRQSAQMALDGKI